MFSIGEFARFGAVSVRMLRHYDEIGLLPPAEIDEGSRYRRYSAMQLPLLHRIVALKELGFSLDEVAAMNGEIASGELRLLLEKRRVDLHNELDERARQIREVEGRLRLIEKEGSMPDYEIKIEPLPRVSFAAIALPLPGHGGDLITHEVLTALLTLPALISDAGIECHGPTFQVYTGDPEAGNLVTYASVAVDDEVTSVPLPAQLFELARVEHAAVVTRVVPHMQGYNEIYAEMATWFEPQGYEHHGAGRDHYVDLSDLATAVVRTEWPLHRRGETPPDVVPVER